MEKRLMPTYEELATENAWLREEREKTVELLARMPMENPSRYATMKMDSHAVQSVMRPRNQWLSLIPGAHEGYIGWEQFEKNQNVLTENCQGGKSGWPPEDAGWQRQDFHTQQQTRNLSPDLCRSGNVK